MDPGPPVDSTTVLSLFVEAWVSWPSVGERGIVATPLLCHGVVRAMERCPPPYPSHLRWERKPTLPAPSLGRRVELTLLTEAWGVFGNLPENINMGDLTLFPICHMVVWVGER